VSEFKIINGDALATMRDMPAASVDAIITDPPYFRTIDAKWDNAWDSAESFLSWFDELVTQWDRLLKFNGSLYCFASPKMSARVELRIVERFQVLNSIRWIKPDQTGARKSDVTALRTYWSPWEACIFAEHYGADNRAKGETGYHAKCDELRGFVFEPLRAYLDGERERAGFTAAEIGAELGTFMQRHWFSASQWELPTAEMYSRLQVLFNRKGGEYLRREYEDLRREYEDLRREYEDLRRPFSLSREVEFNDLWTFNTTPLGPHRHTCEKPVDMLKHLVGVSTRPGATVLDCFAGSGSTGEACVSLGRDFIGIEADPAWCQRAQSRLVEVAAQGDLFNVEARSCT
jgi:adenine-specific DNA-methyltransferase